MRPCVAFTIDKYYLKRAELSLTALNIYFLGHVAGSATCNTIRSPGNTSRHVLVLALRPLRSMSTSSTIDVASYPLYAALAFFGNGIVYTDIGVVYKNKCIILY